MFDYVGNEESERTAKLNTTAEHFPLGTFVCKTKGSKWSGKIVGYYSTELTPHGVAIESHTETGSVQIYPINAIVKDD